MPPKLCGAKPDAIQGSPIRRIRRTHLLKAAALEFIIPHSPSKSTPHHRKFPHRPTFTPPPSAHCPQKRSHTPQLQQNSPSNPSPTTVLQHSPSFFDPFPDETTRFRSLPLQKVHPAFHPAPSPIPKQPDSKALFPPSSPFTPIHATHSHLPTAPSSPFLLPLFKNRHTPYPRH